MKTTIWIKKKEGVAYSELMIASPIDLTPLPRIGETVHLYVEVEDKWRELKVIDIIYKTAVGKGRETYSSIETYFTDETDETKDNKGYWVY